MAKALLLFFFTLVSLTCVAQKNKKPAKPQVLVYGHEADAFAAAVQSAQSGVETWWVLDSTDIGGTVIQGDAKQVKSNEGLDVGIWALFLSKLANVKEISDSASATAKLNIAPRIAQNAFEGITDTVEKLTIKKNLTVTHIEKSGKTWQVILSNKEKIKIRAIVDASKDNKMQTILSKSDKQKSDSVDSYALQINYKSSVYRTGVAVAQIGDQIFNIPLKYILPDSVRMNYFYTRAAASKTVRFDDINALPLLMLQGQACGAAAAYCAFFNTSSDKINTRTLQGELLAFKSFMIPFQDITLDDPHYPQIQRVGATGILEGSYSSDNNLKKFLFNADHTVSSSEVEPVLKQLYTRSQIWFKDKELDAFSLKDLLDLIKYVGNRGNELNTEVEKGWIKRFKFKDAYNLDTKLTRREFAVLIDTYLQPFNVRVTLEGTLKY